MEERPSKIKYYLDMAKTVSNRSTCLRRKYGTVIVNQDEVVSVGYNGSPRGMKNCCDKGYCTRDHLNCEKGSGYLYCPAVHAEQNAIISASRKEMSGGIIYIAGFNCADGSIANSYPCNICARLIVNAGIKQVFYFDENGTICSSNSEILKITKDNSEFQKERIIYV